MKETILLYSHPQDPACQVLLRQDLRAKGVRPLSITQLLKQAEIRHIKPSGQGNGAIPIGLEWDLGEGMKLFSGERRDQEHPLIINRIVDVPACALEGHAEINRPYVYKEIYSYLCFALPLFPNITSRPDIFGTGLTPWPLHYQWNEAASLGLEVPTYFNGFKDENPYQDLRENVIYSLPQKVYDWKGSPVSLVAPGSKEKAEFCFLKPRGVPYQVLLSGDAGLVVPVRSSFYQGEHALLTAEKVLTKARLVTSHFRQRIAELLFFVEGDGDVITFGMLSPSLSGYKTMAQFEEVLLGGLGLR